MITKKILNDNTKRWFAALFLVVLSASALHGQVNLKKQVLEGLNSCYNFKWNKAEAEFQQIINRHPDDPRGYLYRASIYLWYYLGNNQKTDLNNFVEYSDSATEMCQKILNENPEDAFTLNLLGTNYSYRSIAFGKAEKYLDAVWASKKSQSFLSEAVKYDSTLYDSYLGLGLYNFAVSQIPTAYRWALSLAGISGDKDLGLQYIKTAAQKGFYSKVEAQYYLAQILSDVLFDYKTAQKYLLVLTHNYPDNILFNYTLAVLQIKQRNLNEAEKLLAKIISRDSTRFKKIKSFSYFLMGDIYYRKNDFENAKDFYLKFLTSTPDRDYTGIASYRLAVSYELTGDRKTAQKFFKVTGQGNMDLEDDIFAKRRGSKFESRPILPEEIKLIEIGNLVEGALYRQAIDSMIVFTDSISTDTLKNEFFLYMSDAYFHLKNYDEALDYALKASSGKDEEELWIKPFAYFYAAKAAHQLKDDEKTKEYLEKIDDYSDFDYQNKLKNLTYSLRKSLE